MRILHLASEYPPQKVFGLGRFVRDLALEQARRGHEVHVVTNSLGGRDREIVDEGVHLHRVDWPPPPKPPDSGTTITMFNTHLLERIFRDRIGEGFDVVNAHDWLTAPAGKVVARRLGALFVVTVHDLAVGKSLGELDNERKYVANIERWMCAEADRVICVSRHTREEAIRAYGARPERTFAIHNAVSERSFPRPEAKLLARFRRVFAPPDEKVVLYVGRLDREKGVDVLLRAFARARERGVRARLVLAGSGALEPELRKLAEDLGLRERVLFAGYLAGAVLVHAYHAADVLVVPSLYEPFGIVALEGMISRLPVVASAAGGLTEIIEDGRSGLLVPPGDVELLAERLGRVLEGAALAARLAEGGHGRAKEKFSWGRVAKHIERILTDPGALREEAAHRTDRGPEALPARTGRILLLVQTHERDFPLLEENRLQFETLVRAGHRVAFLCRRDEAEELAPAWCGLASVIETDVPGGHEHLVRKCAAGYRAALRWDWDWLVKIDSDVLVSGDIPASLAAHSDADAVGMPSTFGPVMEAIRKVGPPDVPADALDRLGGRYLKGFFYAVRRRALERALPLFEAMARRVRVEDATLTAALAATGARIRFREDLNYYVSLAKPSINPLCPVVHVESRNVECRAYFAARAQALFVARETGPEPPADGLDLSVVIQTRDRKALLLRTLATLRAGCPAGEAVEVVVVDYGGTDGLAEDLRKLAWPGLRYIYAEAPGRFSSAHARNIGLRAARGRWVLMLDGDLLLPPRFLGRILGFFRECPDQTAYGPVYKLPPGEQDRLEAGETDPVRDFAALEACAREHRIDPPSGAIIAAPRVKLLAIGGYDEGFTGYGFQDIDLVERLKRSGLAQVFPEGLYALHQFHGYPADYNTPGIEEANRRRFLAMKDTLVRNAGCAWGALPQGGIDLQKTQWVDPGGGRRARAAPVAEGAPRSGVDGLVWCDSASEGALRCIRDAARLLDPATCPWRWVASGTEGVARARRAVGAVPPGHRFETHTSAQVMTQLARARLLVLPSDARGAGDLREAAGRLGTPVAAVEGTSTPEALADVVGKHLPTPEAPPAPAAVPLRGPVRKVLVGMDEGIGNMVLLTPMLRALAALHPEAEVHVMGKRPALDVLDSLGAVARCIDVGERPETHYDLLLATGWRRSLAGRLKGVKFANPPVVCGKIVLDAHESEQHMDLVRRIGYAGPTPEPSCAWTPYDLPDGGGRPRVGLADTSNPLGWEKRHWPYYRELAAALLGKSRAVYALGGKNDAELYRERPWPGGVVDLQGRTSLRETAGAIRALDLLVANDCGLAHMAAALGVRTLCLWGSTSAVKSRPLGPQVEILSTGFPCSPCWLTPRWGECREAKCLSTLSVDAVLEAADRHLDGRDA